MKWKIAGLLSMVAIVAASFFMLKTLRPTPPEPTLPELPAAASKTIDEERAKELAMRVANAKENPEEFEKFLKEYAERRRARFIDELKAEEAKAWSRFEEGELELCDHDFKHEKTVRERCYDSRNEQEYEMIVDYYTCTKCGATCSLGLNAMLFDK